MDFLGSEFARIPLAANQVNGAHARGRSICSYRGGNSGRALEQLQMGDFCRAAESPRQDNRANAATNVNLRGCHPVPTDLVSQPFRRASVHGAKMRQVHLSAMRMP